MIRDKHNCFSGCFFFFCDAFNYKSYVDIHFSVQHMIDGILYMPFESKPVMMQMWCSMCLDNGEHNGVEGEAIFPSNF